MSLKGGDLLVDPSNILLDYVCEFLSLWSLLDNSPAEESFAYANFHRTIVEQSLSLSNLWDTVSEEGPGTGAVRSRWASFPRRIVVVLISLAIAEASLVNSLLGESFA